MEAATLVGVLHHYRIASPGRHELCTNALELHASVELVSRVSGFPSVLLRRLYRDHWIELQGVPCRRLRERLERHELVRELVAFPGWR